MDVFSIAAGAAGVGLLWFLKLSLAKAAPAALAWLKSKWPSGKAGTGLAGALAELQDLVAEARRDIEELKAKVATKDPLAPAFLQPAAPIAAAPAPVAAAPGGQG